MVDRDEQFILGQAVFLGDQVPSVLDGVFLEVVTKGKVAEHLEEGVVTRRVAHVFKVVVLPASADTLLGGHGAVVGALFLTQKDVLELNHARVREHEGRVIAGDQR